MDGRDTADDAPSIPSLVSIKLDLPPSCIEFSPLHSDVFIVGTYCLELDSGVSHTTSIQQQDDQIGSPAQDRRGSLMLFLMKDKTV